MGKMPLKACFEAVGTVPKNSRWSWSGRSTDGSRVSVTLWQDQFENGATIYRSTGFPADEAWVGSPGHNELIDNLAWAEDRLGGVVSVIIAIARDATVSPRSIRECFPVKNWRMKVAFLDRSSGEFILERFIEPGGGVT
ncbi:hypothetical protein CSC94_16160 [Zhengella mangrovi]|uniref:Uncharacterized protein n=1 Tax=Zhengella mangrovi TaxID=1982044 RepID=A0A2G1QKX5_9HYPH|nr:hypothetical protein [Zhengella mangrovi]PHP66129.1 hypothetical protein CSC94_16160 [Zhengella mangrovi]